MDANRPDHTIQPIAMKILSNPMNTHSNTKSQLYNFARKKKQVPIGKADNLAQIYYVQIFLFHSKFNDEKHFRVGVDIDSAYLLFVVEYAGRVVEYTHFVSWKFTGEELPHLNILRKDRGGKQYIELYYKFREWIEDEKRDFQEEITWRSSFLNLCPQWSIFNTFREQATEWDVFMSKDHVVAMIPQIPKAHQIENPRVFSWDHWWGKESRYPRFQNSIANGQWRHRCEAVSSPRWQRSHMGVGTIVFLCRFLLVGRRSLTRSHAKNWIFRGALFSQKNFQLGQGGWEPHSAR